MSTITINPGEHLVITFADSDGKFEVHFDSPEFPKQLVIREADGLPGNRIGAASAILYHEDWSNVPRGVAEEETADTPRKSFDQHLADLLDNYDAGNQGIRKELGASYLAGKLKISVARARTIWMALIDAPVRSLTLSYLRSPAQGREHKDAAVLRLIDLASAEYVGDALELFDYLVRALANPEPAEVEPLEARGLDARDA